MWHRQVGARLRAIRELRGKTQTEVAEAIDVAQSTLNKWEKGTRRMHDENIYMLCQVLDVTPTFLLLGIVSALTVATTNADFCDWLLAPQQRERFASVNWRGKLNRARHIAAGRRRHAS